MRLLCGPCLILLLIAAAGCGRSESPPLDTTAQPRPLEGEPIIRVRLGRHLSEVTIGGPGRLEVFTAAQPASRRPFGTPLKLQRVAGRWLLPNQAGGSFDDTRPVVIRKIGPEPLQFRGRTYPGSLVLVPTRPLSESRFDLINHVSIEQYLPGVLDSELPDNWAPAAYLAQAITARSYALVQIRRYGTGRHYDLVSGPASQAYRGITPHAMSRIAVRDTAGLVLSWNDRILPGYYSSTCGGVGQSPREAFGSSNPPRPLIPRYDHPHWCRKSRHYRWGPIKRDLKTLSERWRAWGKHHNRPIQQLGTIRSIIQAQRNPGGRVIRFEIQDDKGNRFSLLSDSLRSASNFSSRSMNIAPPPANQRLKSGYVEVKILGGVVVFPEGRGYGHGVGLCQYGAQAMATAGKDPIEILAEYFPQAKVERAY